MPDPGQAGQRRPLSFGVHQGLEYLVAILLALTAIRLPPPSSTPALLVALAVIVLAVVTDGPLGGFRLLSPRTHRVFDVVLVMLVASGPLVLGRDDISVVVMAALVAVVFAVLTVRTSYVSAKRRPPPRPVTPPPARPTPPVVTDAARAAGRVVGRVRRDGPRALGRFVGRHTKR